MNKNNFIIPTIGLVIGFALPLLGFELSREAYKDVFGTLIMLFASMVAFIGMFFIFRLENLNTKKKYAFEHLRNVIGIVRSLVITENLGGVYQDLVRFDYVASITDDLLLTNVDELLKRHRKDGHFKGIIGENNRL